jgi:hypothetical protein
VAMAVDQHDAFAAISVRWLRARYSAEIPAPGPAVLRRG